MAFGPLIGYVSCKARNRHSPYRGAARMKNYTRKMVRRLDYMTQLHRNCSKTLQVADYSTWTPNSLPPYPEVGEMVVRSIIKRISMGTLAAP